MKCWIFSFIFFSTCKSKQKKSFPYRADWERESDCVCRCRTIECRTEVEIFDDRAIICNHIDERTMHTPHVCLLSLIYYQNLSISWNAFGTRHTQKKWKKVFKILEWILKFRDSNDEFGRKRIQSGTTLRVKYSAWTSKGNECEWNGRKV